MVMQTRKVALLLLLAVAEASASHPKLRRAEVSEVVDADVQAPDASAVIMSPMGPDGYPTLPAVATMLDTASETLRVISSQTDSLEKRMLEAQAQNQAKMARQKMIFEQKLKSQETANRAVVAENNKVTKEIDTLKSGNNALRHQAKDVRDGNKVMRDELRQLQAKLGVARAFIATSLVNTDDSHAKELAVLDNPTAAAPPMSLGSNQRRITRTSKARDDEDDKDDDESDDDEDDKESFVEVAARVSHVGGDSDDAQPEVADALAAASAPQKPANPRDLLQVLSRGIENLAQEEKASEAKLRSLFLHQYQAGAKRHAELISEQKKLVATRAQLKAVLEKLKVAEAHLEDSKSRLSQRLRALGLFMQKLQHLALAPAGEAPRLMEALPAAVAMQEAEKAHM